MPTNAPPSVLVWFLSARVRSVQSTWLCPIKCY